MRFSWAVRTDPGLQRSLNEDSFCARADLGLFVVADGMGGHAAGEVASRTAVEALEAFADATAGQPPPAEGGDAALGPDGRRLKEGFRLANRRIAEAAGLSEARRGMATTLAALLLGRTGAAIAHVGDSRVYLLRGGRLTQVTRDHSWVEEQVRHGTLTATAARRHPWRNVVTRALAGGDDPEVDVVELGLQPGDRLLLCSDGLSGVLSDEEIRSIVTARADLQNICDRLVAAANAAGGPDNVTALLLQVDAL
ncbi:MAG TPA: Stp1/IreP family PP2C-type Ser/Thr phosphatase [Vicinamibacterales bacterium]|nr:Stp1/IreP family PP2C-type Ser/Thr phosphatase [Vicinamibacterales bacterium]